MGWVEIKSFDEVVTANSRLDPFSKGVQGSNTDFLLCALSVRYDLAIFTIDEDFKNYAKHLPIRLHVLR